MLIDLATTRSLSLPDEAVVVVGSGAAGIALSQSLTAQGERVVLLESGPDLGAAPDAVDEAQDLNAGTSDGIPFSLRDGRRRTLGGTTQAWHGQCMRLHLLDLEERPWVAHSGWPLSFEQLREPYVRAERWMGVTGLGYGPQRWDEHPSLPPLAWDSERLLHDFTEYTPDPLLGRLHRSSLVADLDLHVVVNATVGRVLVTDGRATGVEVVRPGGDRQVVHGRAVVLAAGAIENARVLQLSDPAGKGLGTGREQTGRYLQDHPIIRTAEVVATDFRVLQDRYVALHRGQRKLFPKVRLAPGVQEELGLVDATAAFVHDHAQPALTAARRLVAAARERRRPDALRDDLVDVLRGPVPVARDAYHRYVRHQVTRNRPDAVWLQVWLEQVPDPASRVVLGADRDGLGLRRPRVTWRISEQERRTSRLLTSYVGADLERLGIGTLNELPAQHDDQAWDQTVTDAFHPAGTTRMSSSPVDGVVDRDLQVHGVPGLHVVGSSVFPIAGYANPTLTIVALALRLSDHLTSRVRV